MSANCRHPLFCIVPPHILHHMARLSEPRLRRLAESALRTIVVSERIRGERAAIGGIAPLAATPSGEKRRTVYDAAQGSVLPGRLARAEGAPAGKDPAVNEAYDGLGATYDFFLEAFGRRSIDGRGMALDATVHYRRGFNNAFWNGRQMVFGDGDGTIFNRFTIALDVIGHELTHGVTEYEAGLEYQGQPGALNEHFSDVFGSLVRQRALGQGADQADWLIGAGLFRKGVQGVAIRSMKAPGTAYDDPRLGKDPQPAHMRDYLDTEDDNGGVHINSGIPNRAFHLAAVGFGGRAWVKAGKVWYLALTDLLAKGSTFADAARVTAEVAGTSFGADAAAIVREAWRAVGIRLRAPRGANGKDGRAADPNRPERRVRGASKGARARHRRAAVR